MIKNCTIDDLPEVIKIHNEIYFPKERRVSQGLLDYYKTVFFQTPWHNDDISSLVFRNKHDEIIGFAGVIARQMHYRGKIINVAVPHRLMVSPSRGEAFAAPRLIRHVLSGPQDLSLADSANDGGRKVWEGAGGKIAVLYSMDWIRPIQPFAYGAVLFSQKMNRFGLKSLTRVGQLVDALGPAGFLNKNISEGEFTTHEAGDDQTFDCMTKLSKGYELSPRYGRKDWKWLIRFQRNNEHRGSFKSFVVSANKNRTIGAFAFYVKNNKQGEVMFLLAHQKARNQVFRCLLNEARKQDLVSLSGKMDPQFFDCYTKNRCLLIHNHNWGAFHTKNEELANSIYRGEAFISNMEGEMWLRSPYDKL